VFAADGFVATFVEQDTRIITVVDNRVSHQLHPLFPLTSFTVFFCISGRHCLYQTYTVAGFYILFPRSSVHPANQIRVSFHHQVIRKIAQPGRYGQTYCRPFVAGALCIPFHLDNTVVQPYLSFREAGLAEAGAGTDFVEYLIIIIFQSGFYRIQVTISPTPEVKIMKDGRCFYRLSLSGFQSHFITLESFH